MHRIVYCSRCTLHGNESEIGLGLIDILDSARRNNPHAGITGALLFNVDSFAQVLEGPEASVRRILATIQKDPRHSDLVVTADHPVSKRVFAQWSMAFAGSNRADELPVARAAIQDVFDGTEGAGEKLFALLQELIVSEGHRFFL